MGTITPQPGAEHGVSIRRRYIDRREDVGAACLCQELTASWAAPLRLAEAPQRLRRPWGGVTAPQARGGVEA